MVKIFRTFFSRIKNQQEQLLNEWQLNLRVWMGVPRLGILTLTIKKFSVTVNFIKKETKTAPNKAMLFCSVFQEVFGLFRTISDHFGRFPKMSENYWSFPRRNSVRCFLTVPRWIVLKGQEWPCFYAFRNCRIIPASTEAHQNFDNTGGESTQSMPPSASTLTKGSWAPDTRLVPSIPQNTVANGWKNETTATAPLSMGSKFTCGLSRAERLWVFHENPSNT